MKFPTNQELTTKQAAELLRISRLSLVEMLENDELPYRKVGIRRRILFMDIVRYVKSNHVRRIELV